MSPEMQLVDEQKHRSALHHEVLDSHGLSLRQKPTGRRRTRTRSAFSRGLFAMGPETLRLRPDQGGSVLDGCLDHKTPCPLSVASG